MRSHLCLSLLGPNKLLILSVNDVLCYFSCSVVLQGNVRVLEEMLTKPKWSLELEWRIFLLRHFKSFTSQFGHVET